MSEGVPSLAHHERMRAAWGSKRFQLEHYLETRRMFAKRAGMLGKYGCNRTLDLASGVGLRVASLRRMRVEAFGFDFSEHVVNNLTIPQAEMFNFVGDAVLDLPRILHDMYPAFVISDDFFEHLPVEDVQSMLYILHDNPSIQGMVHSLTPLEHEFDIHNDPTHITKLPAEEWREVLTCNGWHVDGPNIDRDRFGVFHLVRD